MSGGGDRAVPAHGLIRLAVGQKNLPAADPESYVARIAHPDHRQVSEKQKMDERDDEFFQKRSRKQARKTAQQIDVAPLKAAYHTRDGVGRQAHVCVLKQQ